MKKSKQTQTLEQALEKRLEKLKVQTVRSEEIMVESICNEDASRVYGDKSKFDNEELERQMIRDTNLHDFDCVLARYAEEIIASGEFIYDDANDYPNK